MEMLDMLPPELQRKIILINKPSVILMSSTMCKTTYKLNLRSLILPAFLQDWFRPTKPGAVILDQLADSGFEERKKFNLCTCRHRKDLSNFYMKPVFVIHAYYLTHKLAELVGDISKYDEPDHRFRFEKQTVNWKELGYINSQHFENSQPSRTERNMVSGFLQVSLPTWHLY